MSSCTRAVLWSTTFWLATTSPTSVPLISTHFDWIDAWISPVSPTISVFSLLISPVKQPSIRTVSLKASLPSNSEP